MNRLELYKRLKEMAYASILTEIPILSHTDATIYASQITRFTMESAKLSQDAQIPESLAEQLGAMLQAEVQLLVASLKETILGSIPHRDWDADAA